MSARSCSSPVTRCWSGVPAGTTIGHVHLYVGDLEQAAVFYHHGLGFDRTGSFPGALFVSAGGYHHHVGLNIWAAGAPVAGDQDARLLEWRLVVPDRPTVTTWPANLAQAGIESAHETTISWRETPGTSPSQ